MANAAGFIQESIWRDQHWRKLSRSAQALYMQLLSQKELDCAGVLPLQVNKWAKGCDSLTVEQVWDDLEELQQEWFVIFDTETDEAFVRTYIRNSNVIKSPNLRKAACKAAVLVGSEDIKYVLAGELRVTGVPEFGVVAEQINPSGTPPEPFRNRSDGTVPEPFTEGCGVGEGEGVPHQPSTQVGVRARPNCSRHETDADENCRMCMRRRIWDQEHAATVESDELERRRRQKAAELEAQRDCLHCDDEGWLLAEDGELAEPAMKCQIHLEAAHA